MVYLDPSEFKANRLGNKEVYCTRMAIAGGGELIVLVPGVTRFGEDLAVDNLIRKYGYRGRPNTLEQFGKPKNQDLRDNMSASSGRHIMGWQENGEVQDEEVYRSPNGKESADGYLIWDMERLLAEVKSGIAAAKAKYPRIESLSIGTRVVDYVLLRGDEPVQSVRQTITGDTLWAVAKDFV